jgi:ABC-type nitrate/sulfonate/bicarbonate transport system substrate-binding protein
MASVTSIRRLRLVVAVVLAASVFTVGVQGAGAEEQYGRTTHLTTVRAAYVPAITWLPAMVAQKTGIFKKNGLNVTMRAVLNLATLPGAMGLQFDIGPTTIPDVIKARVNNIDRVVVSGEQIETQKRQVVAVLARKGSGITRPRDLVGKTVAAGTFGGNIHPSTLYWLQRNGVDPSSVKFVEVPFPFQADQLSAGRVDAVEALDPFKTQMLEAGNVLVGDPVLAVASPAANAVWMAQGSWARSHRDAIKRWIRSLQQARAWIARHQTEARAILVKYTGLPQAVASSVPIPVYSFTVTTKDVLPWVNMLGAIKQVDPSKVKPDEVVVGGGS